MQVRSFEGLTIAVCTMNRPKSLRLFLESCIPLIKKGNVNVIIVDSSKPPIQAEDLGTAFEDLWIKERIQLCYEIPGIPRQRNRALAEIKSKIVTFVDDDITLPSNFSELILEHFNQYPLSAGVAPRILGMYEEIQISNGDGFFTRRYKQRVQKRFGKVSNNGENFWYPTDYIANLEQCDWLPGCCMTYNFEVLKDLIFNVCLENGPGKNYAVGEDIDFSTRASDLGPLYLIGALEIEHREEPSPRDQRMLMARARGAFRAYLTYEKRISFFAALYQLFVNVMSSLFRVLFGKLNAKRSLLENLVCLVSYVHELYLRDLRS